MYRPMPGFLILRRSRAIFMALQEKLAAGLSSRRRHGSHLTGANSLPNDGKDRVQNGMVDVFDHLRIVRWDHGADVAHRLHLPALVTGETHGESTVRACRF